MALSDGQTVAERAILLDQVLPPRPVYGVPDIVVPLTVTINKAAGQADPVAANAGPVLFTAVFSEAAYGFTASDVNLSASTGSGTKVATVSGGPTTFTVSVTGMVGAGNVVASIPASSVTDYTGAANSASTSTDNSVAVT